MGQSFWSRGPALSTHFTAKDFPNLKPLPGLSTDDYAAVLQATLELTQMLYNAHGILYPSTDKTLALIHEGDYPRYLDDFQRSASRWHKTWLNIGLSDGIKTTLLLLYEYICLYVNAFSFQAILIRASELHSKTRKKSSSWGRQQVSLFSQGLMSLPDGPYVYKAIEAARKILSLIDYFGSRDGLQYLPTRHLLYVTLSPFLPPISLIKDFHRKCIDLQHTHKLRCLCRSVSVQSADHRRFPVRKAKTRNCLDNSAICLEDGAGISG